MKATHIVGAKMIDGEGNIIPTIECHNNPDDPHRDCLLLEEVECEAYLEDGECEIGGYNDLFGHGHPMSGCGAKQYLEGGGIEAVSWGELHEFPVALPAEARMRWVDGEYPQFEYIPPIATPSG